MTPTVASPSSPPRPRRTAKPELGFHADAYGLWATGTMFREVGAALGFSERQIQRWAKAERWTERLEAAQRKALERLESRQVDKLANLALVHQRGAKKLRRYALGLLDTGAVEVDPMSGRAHVTTSKDPTDPDGKRQVVTGLSYRPLLPGEVNQAALAFSRAADIEFGRAGGKTGANEVEHRFPDLVELLTKVNEERAAETRMKSAGAGSTVKEAHPKNDPRLRALSP